MSNDRSITDQKAAFIRSQIRLLSAPLNPSPAWQDIAAAPVNDDSQKQLSQKVVQDIVDKVNTKLRTHNRSVYSTQSQRHVAEQIDALYWNEVAADTAEVDQSATWVKRNADLCDTTTITSLPEDWRHLYAEGANGSLPATVNAEQAEQYNELRQKLADLNERRTEQMQKLNTYTRLAELMAPYEDARVNIQPNLVTKDGELSHELERMRMLIAKVISKGDQLRSAASENRATQQELVEVTKEDKLAQLLGGG